ncbi:hypothetical protein T484DRAFT_1808849 [Baffinella frigidus]|nr:hypothetical protein T484DRAFT_1808849 [Cryptophyta sp. CCMP2293]
MRPLSPLLAPCQQTQEVARVRGGAWASPEEVARVLEEHPDVSRARVLPVPAHDQGHVSLCVELRAFAVLLSGSHSGGSREGLTTSREGFITGADLRAWLAERLESASVPRAVYLRTKLPLSATGKVDDKALAASAPEDDIPHGHATGKVDDKALAASAPEDDTPPDRAAAGAGIQ